MSEFFQVFKEKKKNNFQTNSEKETGGKLPTHILRPVLA